LQRPRCWYFRNELFPCRKKGGEICYAQQGENQYHAIFNNGVCAIVHPSAAQCALGGAGGDDRTFGDKGAKREVKLEEFFTLPNVDVTRENSSKAGEIITEILVPALPEGRRSPPTSSRARRNRSTWPIAEVGRRSSRRRATRCKSASISLGRCCAESAPREGSGGRAQGQAGHARQRLWPPPKAALADASPMTQNGYKLPVFEVDHHAHDPRRRRGKGMNLPTLDNTTTRARPRGQGPKVCCLLRTEDRPFGSYMMDGRRRR
jgi:xanthine dehydrogenase YagS FAD-binding subunit